MRKTIYTILLALAAGTALPAQSATDSLRTVNYTTERPLVYEDAWDLWPYVFLNENGEPDGYNIDLLKLIMKGLDIPYIVKLKPTSEARSDLKEGRSDLMCGMDAPFTKPYARHGNAIVHLFTHSIVMPKSKRVDIRSQQDLTRYAVGVHTGSLSHHLLENNHWAREIIPYTDMKEAMQQVSAEDNGLLLWNTMSLKWLMRKYHTDNLMLVPIEMPYGEYKFMSNDPHLLARIDSMHNVLKADNRLQPLQNKWFYPEHSESGIPSWIWKLIVLLVALSALALLYYTYFHMMEKRMTREVRKKNARLSLIMKTSGVSFWTYAVATKTFTMMDGHGRPMHDFTPQEFSQRYSAETFARLQAEIDKIVSRQQKTARLDVSAHNTGKDDEERDFSIVLSVLRQDKDGNPTVIMCTRNDVTDQHVRERKTKDTMLRYQSIFNTAMVDMMHFDADGVLRDLNTKACDTINSTREEALQRGITLDTITGIEGFSQQQFDVFYTTQKGNVLGGMTRRDDGSELSDYELQLVSVNGSDGHRIGIYATGRDVSEVADSYTRQQENVKQLQAANQKVAASISDIDYVLSSGGVRMARYTPSTHALTVYSEINRAAYTLTQTRGLALVNEKSKRAAQRLLNSMDNGVTTALHADIQTSIRLKEGYPLWLQAHFIPVTDEKGRLQEYFGMFRDISKLMAVEAELEQETRRAQEVETVKNSFLRNMSYEIRTPLNTVVGFAELFESEHSPEDEEVFSNEIKESSSKLLKLINDILFLSRLDADMIDIKPRPIDFAMVFESRCDMAWANDKKPGVEYRAEGPYEHLMVEIDDLNLNIVIEKIINNATQHTDSGMVLARYDYIGEQLVVSIEDTGSGIPEQSVAHIFERFVTGANSGAGLGLSICSELIRHMGGTINLKSTEGKGTTVWFSIPCKATEIVRK